MKTPKCNSHLLNYSTRHRWKRVGGCKENPGYVGIGGSAIALTEECTRCGMTRTKVFGDANRYGNANHGWRYSEED